MTTDYGQILEALLRHDVDFIVVGAVSAVLQGATITTFDLDVLYDIEDENLDALIAALDQLDAAFRGHPGKELNPKRSHLAGGGHHLLLTNAGPLDVLGEIEDKQTYRDLIGETVSLELDAGVVDVLDVRKYLQFQKNSDRDKAQARIPELETLVERLDDSGD